MNERKDSVQTHLRKEDVQQRIQQAVVHARNEATVTIKQAAELFGFTENQLRDWEDRGLLTPERPQHETGAKGRRLYGPTEIVKLAIIRELKDANYSPSDIPTDIYQIWSAVATVDYVQGTKQIHSSVQQEAELSSDPIDTFVDNVYQKQLFLRYVAARLLYIALMLIGEEMPNAKVAIILPRYEPSSDLLIHRSKPSDLQFLGESLVGWLGSTRTFYMRLMSKPTFNFESDYRVEPLQETTQDVLQEEMYWSRTWIIVQRETPNLSLSKELVETMQRLLQPLYDRSSQWKDFWGYGERYGVDPVINFSSTTKSTDAILTGLANMVVELGGKTDAGQSRWRFCCILLPKDSNGSLPLPQQSLVVRAGSALNPHKPHTTVISPEGTFISLSLRAFQSGHIVYRHDISVEDPTIELRKEEGNICSAIALPVGAQDGDPVAVLYITSDEPDSFSVDDQRVLQIICRIIEEFVRSYRARFQSYSKMSAILTNPGIVDGAFEKFRSEEDFINDTEKLLCSIQERVPEEKPDINVDSDSLEKAEAVVSFIGIDIDDQSTIANRYGDRLARNLSLQMGLRIRGHLLAIFRRSEDWQLYHIYADRFYLMLHGTPMQRARAEAEKLRTGLKGSYMVDALRTSTDSVPLLDWLVEVPNITVRLAVTSYPFEKLYDMLQQMKLGDVSANIRRSLDAGLKRGKDDDVTHGDVVYSWDNDQLDFVRLSPSKGL